MIRLQRIDMDKQLAKRLIEEAIERGEYSPIHLDLLNSKDKKNLAKDLYCKYLAGLITLEDIREELK